LLWMRAKIDNSKRTFMATDNDVRTDVQAHVKSYSRFAAMMKWGTIISFIVAFLVVIAIST
jgi:hypothetical protein